LYLGDIIVVGRSQHASLHLGGGPSTALDGGPATCAGSALVLAVADAHPVGRDQSPYESHDRARDHTSAEAVAFAQKEEQPCRQ
jgi:hypothetical protein